MSYFFPSRSGLFFKNTGRLGSLLISIPLLAALNNSPANAQSPTVLPTDIVPLPAPEERETLGETFGVKVLQSLPSKFYLNLVTEASFRNETNVYQSPTKRQVIRDLRLTPDFFRLTPGERQQALRPVSLASIDDEVFRIFPNVTAGWAFTERTRAFANYFLIRDSLFHNVLLNNTTQSLGGGIQHDFPIGRRLNLQTSLQFRELFQSNQPGVFDYLPNATLSYYVTPKTIAFMSALLQLRGKEPFVSPTREIDPFYSVGFVHKRGRWTLSCTGTYLTNYRQMFGRNAQIRQNNQSFICDFELDRQIFKKVPGLEAFIRAEPIFNFASKNTIGLSGVDFRLFYGIRGTLAKQALTTAMKNLRKQLEDPGFLPPQGLPTSSYNGRFQPLASRRPTRNVGKTSATPVALAPKPQAEESPSTRIETSATAEDTVNASGERKINGKETGNSEVLEKDKTVSEVPTQVQPFDLGEDAKSPAL